MRLSERGVLCRSERVATVLICCRLDPLQLLLRLSCSLRGACGLLGCRTHILSHGAKLLAHTGEGGSHVLNVFLGRRDIALEFGAGVLERRGGLLERVEFGLKILRLLREALERATKAT